MSRPRYYWFGIALKVIQKYPSLKMAVEERESQSITPAYEYKAGRSSATERKAERAAISAADSREYDDYHAVRSAIEAVKEWEDGEEILEIVRLHDWLGLTFERIGEIIHSSEPSVKNRHTRFVYKVAEFLGY